MIVDRYIENGKRYYVNEDGEDYLSVTTILDEMEKPVELTEWQNRNDGEGDNADHEHLLWYKSNRGTLLHYEVLSMFEYAHEESELYSEDEAQSEEELFDNHRPSALYSVLKDRGELDTEKESDELKEEVKIEDVYEEDRQLFRQIFNIISIKENINSETVNQIEKTFLGEPEEGVKYGGQIDMIYEKNGRTHVADLKTSSGVREKHLMQGAAYAKSLDADNPVVQVIRIHPDSGNWEVASIEGDELEQKWSEFKELAHKAYSSGGE